MLQTSIKNSAFSLERAFAVAGLAAVGGLLFVIKAVNPTSSGLFPQCPFYAVTGLHCPGCGATRGMHALLNGDAAAALDYNVLLVVFVPMMLFFLASLLSVAARGKSLRFPRFAPTATWILFGVLLVFGVLRNLPFYPFTVLAP
jgi:hypothetical protein